MKDLGTMLQFPPHCSACLKDPIFALVTKGQPEKLLIPVRALHSLCAWTHWGPAASLPKKSKTLWLTGRKWLISKASLTLHRSWIAQISTLQSRSVHCARPQQEAFLVGLKIASDNVTNQLPFGCDDTRKQVLLLKTTEENKEDIKEVATSPAAAIGICLCCKCGSFIRNGWNFDIKRRTGNSPGDCPWKYYTYKPEDTCYQILSPVPQWD